jgi:hypothetical protein
MDNLDDVEKDVLGTETKKRPEAVYNNGEPYANSNQIKLRLENCQFLEMLYLVKHEELMKTFAFTLNLFDKYKYSIKLLLFVLKNLVRKNVNPPVYLPGGYGPVPGPFPPVGIKLPKKLIPNIVKLLDDQKKVQDVINLMKTNLDKDAGFDFKADETTEPRNKAKVEGVNALDKLSRDQSKDIPSVGPSNARTSHDLSNEKSPINAHNFTAAPPAPPT